MVYFRRLQDRRSGSARLLQTAFLSIYSRKRCSRMETIFNSPPSGRRVHQFLVWPDALFFLVLALLCKSKPIVNSTIVSTSPESKNVTGVVRVYFRSGQRLT